ncbi:hypothetical protein FJZ17_01540 [Candidatus Pacearchaeota archaeon]|nr:hypothetical protein [Candidatus Pacearchaeota archaeon]
MVNWVLIGIGLLAIIIVSKLIHFRHIKHRITAILIILLLLFTYVTFTTIVNSNSIDIKSASGIYQAAKAYGTWFVLAWDNVKALTGQVVNMDWFPKNYNFNSTTNDFSESNPRQYRSDVEYA